jgi:hypothetical protein
MSSWAPTMLTEMKRMRTGCRFGMLISLSACAW